MSQSNNNADCVSPNDRFKFLDDLSILEIVNVLIVGITSYNYKQHMPNDIGTGHGYIPGPNLKTQEYLDKISLWTKNLKIEISSEKSEMMMFNFTKNNQFSTRLNLDHRI